LFFLDTAALASQVGAVTASPSDPTAVPRFRLYTFGTLRLAGSTDDTVLGDHGHQRRRLALLAVLAASRERGRSRDQLLGLFWPDVSQAKARHSLEQLLYAIRTSLDGSVFAGLNPLRINSDLISSDIDDFSDALARGEREAAVELYRGPFLEGFYLNDAPDFEQWTDAERARIERSYTEALEQLARSAEDANDPAEAARWLQKLVETDRVSSKHATGLIRALMNAGDHAAALQYAERYESIVARELGTNAGPAVAALVAEVRAKARSESVVVRGGAPPPMPMPAPSGRAEVRSEVRSEVGSEVRSEVTPEAEPASPESYVAAQPRRRPSSLRRAALYATAMLALATLFVSGWWLRARGAGGGASVAPAPSIAVLPLANLGGNAGDAALVDGLSEELIGVLAKIDRLRVVARTSAFVFKNSNLSVRQIADSLGVSNILEGGVQKSGQRLRVQVRLVDARDGSTRWSETYDRDLKDIFLVQSEIAAAVARELDLRLVGATRPAVRPGQTQNIAAYELYLRGNDPILLRSDSGMRAGLGYFNRAIALDSTYAAAYVGQARMYTGHMISAGPAGDFHRLAREAAIKAIALDDSLGEAHAILGGILMRGYDLAGAERELKRAIAIDPGHSLTRQVNARFFHWVRRPADARAEAGRALANDPLSPTAHAELGYALCANRQTTDGLAQLKRLESVQPPLQRASFYAGLCHGINGDWPAAVEALRKSGGPAPGFLGHALARAGKREEALVMLAEFIKKWQRTSQGAFQIAVVHAGLGDRDRAFEWLDRSFDDLSLVHYVMLPVFDDLHADPRFERLERRLRLQNL